MASKFQLISPPPEETLHLLVPKRKRDVPLSNIAATPHTTPNPKPRKQLKHRSQNTVPLSPSKPKLALVQSPHAANPDADYILPAPLDLLSPAHRRTTLSARASRRSATPIPPYEPPTDIFTPPKEVYVAATTTTTIKVPKSSKRKSTKKKKATPAPAVVKLEMPDVDLDAPMPPPSPGDDPLLLSSSLEPASTPTRPKRKPSWTAFSDADLPFPTHQPIHLPPARRTTSPTQLFTRLRFNDLPPSSPPHHEQEQPSPITDDPADLDTTPVHMPFFDPPDISAIHNDGWTDSDDDGGPDDLLPIMSNQLSEGQGEYTGRWKELLVRTKADPPSSATRCRIELWGNPKSPFPFQKRNISQEPGLTLVQEEQVDSHLPSDDEREEEEVRRMSVEPEPEEQQGQDPHINESLPTEQEEVEPDTTSVAGHIDYLVPVMEHEGDPSSGTPLPGDASLEVADAEDPFKLMGNQPIIEQDPETLHDESEHIQDHASNQIEINPTGDDEPSGDSDMDEGDIVKIISADPRAAARAAAILKQHNYDCFTRLELKRRHSEAVRRRSATPFDLCRESNLRDVSPAGICKKDRRRTNLAAGVIGDSVFIPGSPATTLPKLLQEAEAEVCEVDHPITSASPGLIPSRHTNLFQTPLPARARSLTPRLPMTPGEMCYDPLTGERLWTKEEWKRLDACFTDERWEISQRLGPDMTGEDGLASVDLVEIESVVERFVEWMGGWETTDDLGPLWSRESLMQRARALRNKQRSGNVAPPTIPLTPRAQSPMFNYRPIMDVPDFTPIRRCMPPPKRQWTSVVPPEECSTPQHPPVPVALLAPRYSHLLDEAIAISKESRDASTSEPALTQDRRKDVLAQEPNTIGKRVKGLIFSYLPTLKNSVPSNTLKSSTQPGLPLPPKEVLDKPRGPVITPAREPLPKPVHPKELVHLQQAPPPPPAASKIPRIVPPKQLVELHPPPPKPATEARPLPRPRRSSGASVKDLIRDFEEMESQTFTETKSRTSIEEWKKGSGIGKSGEGARPAWRP